MCAPLPACLADLGYDANGNVQTKTTASGTTSFTYDPLDRIDTEAGPAATRDHEFDANGNRATDSAGNTASYAPNSNRLATLDGIPVTLDAAGRITHAGSHDYDWYQSGRLKQVRQGTTQLARYEYNYRGLRTRKVTTAAAPQGAGTTDYYYDQQGHLLAETTGTASPLKTYIWRDASLTGVIVHQPSRTVYTVRTDHLGSPYEVMTLTGKVVWRWESEAFGKTAPNEDPDGDGNKFTFNLRFPGQYFDVESGLFYNFHRYYSPRLGRYISADPIGLAGGPNPFGYANQNPLTYIDPNGLAGVLPGPIPLPMPGPVIPGFPSGGSRGDDFGGLFPGQGSKGSGLFFRAPRWPDRPSDDGRSDGESWPKDDKNFCIRTYANCQNYGWTGYCNACFDLCKGSDTGDWPFQMCKPKKKKDRCE